QASERRQLLLRGDARVDLDRHLGGRRQMEVAGEALEDALELRGRVVGGRAAAPVQLRNRATCRQVRREQVDLAVEIPEVLLRGIAVFRDDHVAAAVCAPLLAER